MTAKAGRRWGLWRRSFFSDWRDGDWRYTWSLSMLLPRIAILRSDAGEPHTIMVYWCLTGVMWWRQIEP